MKINVFRFQARDACQMRLPVQNWSRQGNILGQPMLFECMGICVLSPAHENEMRAGLPCSSADYEILIDFV